jgi:hypothetical protein
MLRVLGVRAAAGYPLRPLISVGRDATGILYHPRQVHEVPGHERSVPVREVVFRAPGTGIEIRWPGPASPIQPASAWGGIV